MIRLKDNWSKILLIIVVLAGAFIIHIFLPQAETNNDETIKNAPRVFFGREGGMDFPPVFFWGENQKIHYLGLDSGRDPKLNYLIIDRDLEIHKGKKVSLDPEIQPEFLFSVGNYRDEVVFGLVSREGGRNQPYLVFPDREKESFIPLEKKISRNNDISGQIYGDNIFITLVEREGQEFRLWLLKDEMEPFLVFSSESYLGLPRMVIDEEKTVHLQWKGSRNNRGISQYQAFNLDNLEPKRNEPLELGFASYHFGVENDRPIFFHEDPGADFLIVDNGFVYITWTDSIWEPQMGLMGSTIKLARMTLEGELDSFWQIQGRNLPFFGNLFLNQEGKVSLIWEDYYNRQFNLLYMYLDEDMDLFSDPERVKEVFASNRLPRVENNINGDFIILGREIDGSSDDIWGITSLKLGGGKWYHRSDLWFIEDGAESILIEGAFILLYSFVDSLGFIARNALSIFFVAFTLYLLQKFRILGKINCFQFIGFLIILFSFFREYIPLFYSSPPADFGLMIFSGVFATALVLWISRDNWFKGGEEFLYLFYTLVWIFSDIFLIYLVLAPGNFMP